MKLKKLDISGFKSFIDRTSIEFPPGISAIVGPNGCGKSNVVDALRWVMGEQSIKQLRGKSMEDIIFSGTEGNPPVNMAEVSLTLLNNNGSIPEEFRDYSEIMVTRRLYRSGESTYFINKQACRLKDIHHLFMGSGMGAKTYAVIQQGSISSITDASPEERRLFLEEAAGITRYKNRKNEALQKLEATNQNLLRVSDIIAEVKRQMSGLKRQAKRATQYQEYQGHIQKLDVLLTSAYQERYTVQINHSEVLLKDLRDTDLENSSKMKQIDAAIEGIKLKRWEKSQEISDQKSVKFETQRLIDRCENDLEHLREDIGRLSHDTSTLESAYRDIEEKDKTIVSELADIEEQNAQLTKAADIARAALDTERSNSQSIKDQLDALQQKLEMDKKHFMELVAQESRYKNTYQNAAGNKESLARRLKRLAEEEAITEKKLADSRKKEDKIRSQLASLKADAEEVNSQIRRLQEVLSEKNTLLNSHITQAQTLELERSKIKSRHAALKKMDDNHEWYKGGVRAILKYADEIIRSSNVDDSPAHFRAHDIMGVMADVIVPEPSFEIAVESVLGESLQYILVTDQKGALNAVDFLLETRSGRSGFIPIPSVKHLGKSDVTPSARADKLLAHITVKQGFEPIVETLLAHVVVADTLQDALHLHNRNGVFQTIVTKNGDIVHPQGIIVGGSKENDAGILAKKQEISALGRQIVDLDQALDTARGHQKSLESDVRITDGALQKMMEQKNKISREEFETEKTFYKISEEYKNISRHLEIVRLEQEQLSGEESDIDDEMKRYSHLIQQFENKVKESQIDVSKTSEKIQAMVFEMESFNKRIVDIKLNMTSLSARLENGRTTFRRLREFKEDGVRRMAQITCDIQQKNEKKRISEQKLSSEKQRLGRMYEQLTEVEQALALNEGSYQEIDAALQEHDGLISSLQSRREEILEKIRLLELEQSQQKIKRDNLIHRLEERYQTPFEALKTAASQEITQATDVPNKTIEEMEIELSQFREKIAAIQDVNLGAITEYEQLKTRFEFLTEQRDDLVKAMDDLHKAIRKINRISQDRFITTFDQVNEKLVQVFPRLFEGGTAKLVLTDPEKPLETGVEFMIHPPGKKITRMSLLSGGEKALSAIAFVFSIFLIKPASFCLMDEIDAPLDEANIDRFSNLLKIIGEQSQIIMITHNKRSMEFADMLFGITMENKGISKVVSVNLDQTGDTMHEDART